MGLIIAVVVFVLASLAIVTYIVYSGGCKFAMRVASRCQMDMCCWICIIATNHNNHFATLLEAYT